MKKIALHYGLVWLGLLLGCHFAGAQIKPHLDLIQKNQGMPYRLENLRIQPPQAAIPRASQPFGAGDFRYRTLPRLSAPDHNTALLKVQYKGRGSTPAAIYGEALEARSLTDPREKIFAQLEAVRSYLQIESPEEEFRIIARREGRNGYVHYKLQQYYEDIPVYGGELTVHLQDNTIKMTNGHTFPTPALGRTQALLSEEKATLRAVQETAAFTSVRPLTDFQRKVLQLEPSRAELVIYHASADAGNAHLAWRVEVVPNVYHREAYFIDAHSGQVLFHQSLLCKAHAHPLPLNGPAIGAAPGLLGQDHVINSYEVQGTFALIDASRPMFNTAAPFNPGDPKGVIWTLDAEDDTPIENDSFGVVQILSDSPDNWADPVSVSAHHNAGKAYAYFQNTFGRNSINDQGSNIISIINITDEDGSSLSNAFWSGTAIFYGNGGQAFQPLARALDVAGHEISHGVIQTTANLEYLSQPGALNESYADIFGAMIDREDWRIGEDVVNGSFFPSGALRDLANPNNGGSGPSQFFWQPAHMDEYVNLPETAEGDNGGVHVNSGIPNRAFFLFANTVGRDIAEQVYYTALVNYLTRFAQFADMRIAVLASAEELYNNNVVAAARDAFDQVGITEEGQGGGEPTEVQVNPGDQVVLFTDSEQRSLNLYSYSGTPIAESFISRGVLGKPSVSDDGSRVVFVDGQQHIQLIDIDWSTNQYETTQLSGEPSWRTAAISKDGRLLAALTDDFDDKLYVFRLDTGEGRVYTLTNPTTAEGITTGTLAYADILEWSLNGRSVMYDALSTISKVDGTIEVWEIGFIDVWNPDTDGFGDGYNSKLFAGLPEGVSVGNPTFSKNSPFIIALDYIDENENEYSVLGVNVLTGKIGTIFSSGGLAFPNYSVDDTELVFDGLDNGGRRVLGTVDLATDKINASSSNAFLLLSGNNGARWGVVFATGDRSLGATNSQEAVLQTEGLRIFPNPVREVLQIELESPVAEMTSVQLFDQLGRSVYLRSEWLGSGAQRLTLPVKDLASGSYVLDIRQSGRRWVQRVVKVGDGRW